MKLNLIFTFILGLFFIQINAQTLRGQVVDATSKEPIPFANITLGENYGVISNDEGFFVIQLKKHTEDKTILISSLGHEEVEILVKDFKQNQVIPLSLSNFELDEVFITNEQLTAFEIVEKFLENKKANHEQNNIQIQLFSRVNTQYEALDFKVDIKKVSFLKRNERNKFNEGLERIQKKTRGKITSVYKESLLDLYKLKDTLINEQLKSLELIKRDESIDTDEVTQEVLYEVMKSIESENTFKVKSGLFTLDKEIDLNEFIAQYEAKKQGNPIPDTLHHKETFISDEYLKDSQYFNQEFFRNERRYEYALEGITNAHGSTCYHIKFYPNKNKAKFEGNLYINTKDFGMVAYDYQLIDGKKTNNINLKAILGIKTNTFQLNRSYIFSRTENGYYAKYIRKNEDSYVYFDRPIKFQENDVRRRDRKILKLGMFMEIIQQENTEYVAIEQQSISEDVQDQLKFDSYILIDELSKYSPSYWEGYNIIEATQAIRSF